VCSSTRISPWSHLVCAVHGRSGAPNWATWSTRPPVCRTWHTGDRILLTTWRQRSAVSYVNLFGWCCHLDAIKLVATQHQQDGAALVCHCTSSSQLPCTPLRVGPHLVNPASTVRDWGIYIDADLSGCTQVLKTTASFFAALWQLRTVRRCLPLAAYKSLIVSRVLSQLDYGNARPDWLPVLSSMWRQDRSKIDDLQSPVVEPRNVSLDGTALVECSRSSQLQACDVGFPLSPWSCSTVPVIIATSCCRHGTQDFGLGHPLTPIYL